MEALLGLGVGLTTWPADDVFVQYTGEGFIGIYGGGNLAAKAEQYLESFLGACLANRVLTYQLDYKKPEQKLRWTVHEAADSGWTPVTRYDVREDICGVLRHVTSFKFNNDYPLEKRGPWLISSLVRIDKLFRIESSKTLLLSSKWYFDSFKGDDSLLQYIRMMTSLEILLGEHADTSKASLGEVLGNRLAYLIGKSHRDRTEVLTEFKKIYGVRSGILHHGKHRLKVSERLLLSKLREFCQRAIEKETELVLA